MTCFSLFVQFALFAVHVSNRSVHCNSHRETDENPESLYGLFLLVCALRVFRGSWNLKRSVPCRRQVPFMEEEAGVGEAVRASPAPGEAFCSLPLSTQETRVFQRGRC